MLPAVLLLAGCGDPIDRLCAEGEPPAWEPIEGDAVAIDAAAWRTASLWGDEPELRDPVREMLLARGLRRVELELPGERANRRHLDEPYWQLPGQGRYVAFEVAARGEPRCLPNLWADTESGLHPDRCIAAERIERPTARWQVRAEDHSPRKRIWHSLFGRDEKHLRLSLREAGAEGPVTTFWVAYRRYRVTVGAVPIHGCANNAAHRRLVFDSVRPAVGQRRPAAHE